MTDSGEVLLDVDGGVAVVTLNAPDRRNALTPGMASELIATFDEVDGRSDVGALVVKAVGKSFCAGGDIATLTSAGQDPAAPDAYVGMGSIYDSFYRLGQVRVHCPHIRRRRRLAAVPRPAVVGLTMTELAIKIGVEQNGWGRKYWVRKEPGQRVHR